MAAWRQVVMWSCHNCVTNPCHNALLPAGLLLGLPKQCLTAGTPLSALLPPLAGKPLSDLYEGGAASGPAGVAVGRRLAGGLKGARGKAAAACSRCAW